jgi:hypothetical protein
MLHIVPRTCFIYSTRSPRRPAWRWRAASAEVAAPEAQLQDECVPDHAYRAQHHYGETGQGKTLDRHQRADAPGTAGADNEAGRAAEEGQQGRLQQEEREHLPAAGAQRTRAPAVPRRNSSRCSFAPSTVTGRPGPSAGRKRPTAGRMVQIALVTPLGGVTHPAALRATRQRTRGRSCSRAQGAERPASPDHRGAVSRA